MKSHIVTKRCSRCHGRKNIRIMVTRHRKTKDRQPCPACNGKGVTHQYLV